MAVRIPFGIDPAERWDIDYCADAARSRRRGRVCRGGEPGPRLAVSVRVNDDALLPPARQPFSLPRHLGARAGEPVAERPPRRGEVRRHDPPAQRPRRLLALDLSPVAQRTR